MADWLRLGLEFLAFVIPIMGQLYALHRRNVQRFDGLFLRMDHLDGCMDRTRKRVRKFERQLRRERRQKTAVSQGREAGAARSA